MTHASQTAPQALMSARELTIGNSGQVVQQKLNFDINKSEVLAVMGPSGCGKSTLMRHLLGLARPISGQVLYRGVDMHAGDEEQLAELRRHMGVLFQAGALWSSMRVGENIMLPMRLFSALKASEQRERARMLVEVVGLAESAFDKMPSELSGGMRKRAALARALALEPDLLFLDEPGSGLDPPSSARLDELVLAMRERLGTAVVMVSHDVTSILTVADRALYLDNQTRTMQALAPPKELLANGPQAVREFLQRTAPADAQRVANEVSSMGSESK